VGIDHAVAGIVHRMADRRNASADDPHVFGSRPRARAIDDVRIYDERGRSLAEGCTTGEGDYGSEKECSHSVLGTNDRKIWK
jgi:hypothetical protein